MSNNAHELSNRLLNALDNSYNVVDMHAVNEIISVLEKFNITKELLETTRLGKHVNELRRKTTDPSLARRAKVLVKRWRDLVIPSITSPGHTGSNRSSAERQVRRLGGTPLTSPALSRQVVSPAVPSPRQASRPAWGGYESDSQDVILVDDDPPLPPPPSILSSTTHKPNTPPVKRPPSPEPLHDEKKAKRDKKPKKRRGHSRAGTGTETPAPASGGAGGVGGAGGAGGVAAGAGPGAGPGAGAAPWGGRNGAHAERRRNGCRNVVEPYAAFVKRMPPVGAKKVKTTKELLEQIQSRSQPVADLAAPDSPDVMLIEPDGEVCPIKVESPLRNGRKSPRAGSPPAAPAPAPAPTPAPAPPPPPLEDEREYAECTCGAEAAAQCPAAAAGGEGRRVRPLHVRALHCAYLPGVNGTRAPPQPHRYAVRPLADPDPARAGLYSSVVPLYKYSDYADDRCAKNMARVPLCRALPWTQFAPAPPDPPPPPQPPEPRPYPLDEPPAPEPDLADDDDAEPAEPAEPAPAPEAEEPGPDESEEPRPVDAEELRPIEAEAIGIPSLEPSERLKAPLLLAEDEPGAGGPAGARDAAEAPAEAQFATDIQDHRTVERTKAEPLDGRGLYRLCCDTIAAVPYDYEQLSTAPVLTLPAEEPAALAALEAALERAREATTRDALGRPARPDNFAEWHECVRLGELVALPYVVID